MIVTKILRHRLPFAASLAAGLIVLGACQAVKIDPVPGDKIGMVLMHGKGGTGKYVWSLGSGLRSAGILVEMPLMPWSKDRIYDRGYEESMAEIDTYVASLRAAGAKRIFVAGHSIGANAALGYAGRRDGVSGAILLAYGHVPGISGFANKLSASTAEAEVMIAAGNGEGTASFSDVGSGRKRTAFGTANDVFSWFDPKGPATIANNAPKVKSGTPVLCIDGSGDRWQRCGSIMQLLPTNPKHRSVEVSAGHLETPAASGGEISKWLQTLGKPAPK